MSSEYLLMLRKRWLRPYMTETIVVLNVQPQYKQTNKQTKSANVEGGYFSAETSRKIAFYFYLVSYNSLINYRSSTGPCLKFVTSVTLERSLNKFPLFSRAPVFVEMTLYYWNLQIDNIIMLI